LFPGISIHSTIIEKKWLENQIELEEDTYESPHLVYYKNADALVLVVRTCIETTPLMPKSWSDSEEDMLKDVVESFMECTMK
jgi:hypothetical protein